MADQRRYPRRSFLKGCSAVAGLTALGGCSGGEPSGANGGGSGDSVVYYGSADRPGFFTAFEEKTGITVNSVTAPGYQSVSRFQTEESNDEHSADVLNSVSQVFLRDELLPYFAEINMWEEFKDVYPSSLVEKVENTANDEERSKMLPVTTNNYTAAYSTARTDGPADSWEAILKPQFKGRIGAPTFTMSSMYWILIQGWSEKRATQYFTDLADHGTKFAGQATSSFTESLVAGQNDIAFGVADSTAVAPFLQDGAPIAPVKTKWTGSTVSPIAVSKNAPHPKAARKLVRFMISKEGQKANANHGAGRPSIRKDVDHGNGKLGKIFSNMKVYPMFVTPKTKDRVVKKANELLPIS